MWQNEFMNYLKVEKHYSPHTIISYTTDINQFREFCISEIKTADIAGINFKHIRYWINRLTNEKYNTRSINRKITTIKTLFKFLLREKIITTNPTENIESLKVQKKLPEILEQNKINSNLGKYAKTFFSDNFVGTRNKLIIEMLYATGIRVSELVNLSLKDVNCEELKLKVLGKRQKERIIPFGKNLLKSIQEYLFLRTDKANKYFFITEKNDKIYSKLVYRIVKYYIELISSVQKKSPHLLRHTFASHLLNNGADINAIKELLGHTTLTATQIYTHINYKRTQKVYNSTHPWEIIKEVIL